MHLWEGIKRARGKMSFSQHMLYFVHCIYHHQITSVHRSREFELTLTVTAASARSVPTTIP